MPNTSSETVTIRQCLRAVKPQVQISGLPLRSEGVYSPPTRQIRRQRVPPAGVIQEIAALRFYLSIASDRSPEPPVRPPEGHRVHFDKEIPGSDSPRPFHRTRFSPGGLP